MEAAAVRRASVDDLADLVRLYRHLVGDDPTHQATSGNDSADLLGHILDQPGRVLLIATLDDQVVGTADLVIVANLTHLGRPWGAVENVVVDETVARQGVGRSLMEAVLEHCRAAGCFKVQLLSRKDRAGAHRFYEALGFEPLAEGYRLYLP